jgi:hypothetical protein
LPCPSTNKAPGQTQRGFPGHAGWPNQHYRVSVLQADGKYDLEKGVNVGDAGDFWVKDMVLGPGPDVWPNTDSYQAGQHPTGLSITVLTDPGFIMIFKVEGIAGTISAAPGFVPSNTTTMLGHAGRFNPPSQGGATKTYQGNSNGSSSTGRVIAWILSLLGGLAVVGGLLVMVL